VVSNIWQIEIHIDESMVFETSPLDVVIFIAKLKRYYNLPGSDKTLAELIHAGMIQNS
jgi:hypothetical protein